MNTSKPIYRLVRCPHCRLLLPELSDLSLYKCGGCGIVLQAKKRKDAGKSANSNLHETDAASIKSLDQDSKENDKRECSLDHNDKRDCSISGGCDNELLGSINLSNEDQKDVFLKQNDLKGCSLSGDCDNEQLGGLNLSNDDQKDLQNDRKDFGLSGACDNEQLRGVDLSDEDQNDGSLEHNDQKGFGFSGACDNEQLRGVDLSDEDNSYEMHPEEVCSPADLSPHQNKELSPLAESNTEVDVGDENSQSDVESNDESSSTIKRSSTIYGTARESISSDMLVSPPTEQMEHSQEGIANAFDRVSSTDTLEATDFINPSSELSGKLIDLSKSPTTRSYQAYYDGSSLDHTDDQSPNDYRHSIDRHRHSLKKSYEVPNHDVPEERCRRNEFPANGDAEMQHQVRKFSSRLLDKMHKWNQDELQKPIRLGYPGGNWRSERDENPSRLPPYGRGSLIGSESVGPSNQFRSRFSNQLHDEFHRVPSTHLHNKHEHTEQEKMKLLRMVNALQDQLNKAYKLNEETQGIDSAGIARENDMPVYYDHKAPEEQGFYNLNHPMLPGRFRQEGNWSRQSKILHKPFSGEATYRRHSMDSCSHPSNCQNSAQLPPFDPFHHKGHCRIHPSQNFRPSYASCPLSPQQHLYSECPLHSRETKSDDQRHRDHGVKRCLREKQYSGKKHLRPIAGAAPLIICHRCWKPLQLPADFLVFRRRCHRLKCGSCSEVIKFSIKNGTHFVPNSPNFKDPPPSEIDAYSDATDRRNLASASHPSESPNVRPVSYCRFSKSCSSDVDPASFTPLHPVPGNAGDRKIPSDSLKSKQERKNGRSLFSKV